MKFAALVVIALLSAGCATPSTSPAEDAAAPLVAAAWSWTPRADAPFILAETAVASEGAMTYIVGGWTEAGGGSPRVLAYDAAQDAWSDLPPYPLPIHHAQAAALDGTLYVFGGAVTQALMPGTFTGIGPVGWPLTALSFKLAPAARVWEPIASLPQERGLGGASILDGQVYIVGGTHAEGYHTDVVVYDPGSDSYRNSAPLPTPRDHLSVVADAGRLYALAGRIHTGAGWDDLEVAEVFDATTGTWAALPPAPLGRGGQGAGVLAGGRIALVGGERAEGEWTVFDAAHAYDPASGVWEELPVLPRPLHGMASGSFEGRLLVMGGGLLDGGIERATWELGPAPQQG